MAKGRTGEDDEAWVQEQSTDQSKEVGRPGEKTGFSVTGPGVRTGEMDKSVTGEDLQPGGARAQRDGKRRPRAWGKRMMWC